MYELYCMGVCHGSSSSPKTSTRAGNTLEVPSLPYYSSAICIPTPSCFLGTAVGPHQPSAVRTSRTLYQCGTCDRVQYRQLRFAHRALDVSVEDPTYLQFAGTSCPARA